MTKTSITQECFKKGNEALQKQNWDFAIEMFATCMRFDPEAVLYRQTLRGCEREKYNNNGSGARLSAMKLTKLKGKLKKAKIQKNWHEVDTLAEEGLRLNPWDDSLNSDLGDAAIELGFLKVAIFAYECAVQKEQSSIRYLKKLGLLYKENNEYDKAFQMFEQARNIDKNDTEAREEMARCMTLKTMNRGGYQDAESTQDVKEASNAYDADFNARSQSSSQKKPLGPGDSEEEDLLRAVRKEPDKPEVRMRLAQYYKQTKEWEKSYKAFQEAYELSNSDPNILEELEDVELLQLEEQLENAKETSQKDAENDDKKKSYATLKKKLVLREVEVFSSRVERYPNKMKLKLDLAQRLMKLKKFQEAIPHLQRASTDTRIKTEALIALGLCFIQEKQDKLALRQFELVIPELNAVEEPKQFCEAHYLAGRLREKAKETDKAEEHYNEVLGVDYLYRDAKDRLEKLQSNSE